MLILAAWFTLCQPGHAAEATPRLPASGAGSACIEDTPGERRGVARLVARFGTPDECDAVVDLLDRGAPGCVALGSWVRDRSAQCRPAVVRDVALHLLVHGGPTEFGEASSLAMGDGPEVAEPVVRAMAVRMPVLSVPLIAHLMTSPNAEIRRITIGMLVGYDASFTFNYRYEAVVEPDRPSVLENPEVPVAHRNALEAVLLTGDDAARRDAAAALAQLWEFDRRGPEGWHSLLLDALSANFDNEYVRGKLVSTVARTDPGALCERVGLAISGGDSGAQRDLGAEILHQTRMAVPAPGCSAALDRLATEGVDDVKEWLARHR